MLKRPDCDLIRDIKEAIVRINQYVKNLDYEKFIADTKTQDAVVRNLEIIGEAVKNLSSDLKQKFSLVPWKNLAGLRDRLIHNYFGVNYEIVWAVASNELSGIITLLDEILNDG